MHKYCGYCGTKVTANCSFCVNCGAKLTEYHEILTNEGEDERTTQPEVDLTCEFCNGKGKKVCDECNGSGICFMCLGSGICVWCSDASSCDYCQESKICMICKGMGKCKNCDGKKYVLCSQCEGTGTMGLESDKKDETDLIVEEITNRNV
jgi:hypothetical protein